MTIRQLGGKGQTKRTKNPRLRFDLFTRHGDANIKSVSVTLSKAFQIDQRHLFNICSKSQLEAERCKGRQPMGNVWVKTPLLDEPLKGPAYAVSGYGKLPHLVFILDGQVTVMPQAESSSVNDGHLKTVVPVIPDAPVGHFRLSCSAARRATWSTARTSAATPARSRSTTPPRTASSARSRSSRRFPAAARSGAEQRFREAARSPRSPASGFRAGRHGLPPEHVVESQRWRLLAAAGEVLAENGYARTRSADIAERAGVSRSTFYSQFENVEACLLAAYEMAADCIVDLVSSSCVQASDPAGRLGVAVDAVLEFLAEDPATIRLLGSEAPAGVPAIAAARETFVDRLAEMLRGVRLPEGSRTGGPPEIDRSLVGGALALVSEVAAVDGAERLPELAPELAELLAHRFQPA